LQYQLTADQVDTGNSIQLEHDFSDRLLVTKHIDTPTDRRSSSTIFRQKLHGLYADTLQEIPGSPLVLDSAFAANHAPDFDPLANNQRAGLTLVTGASNTANIWVTWGSHCDNMPYSGLAIEFDYTYGSPSFASSYEVAYDSANCTGTTHCQAGLWMAGGALAADSTYVYVATGNDSAYSGGSSGQYGNSVLKLQGTGVADYYSPPDYLVLNKGGTVACTNPNPQSCNLPCKRTGQYCQVTLPGDDWDLGSAGVVLLSPTFSLTNPELVAGGKQGMLYVAFSGSLGGVDGQSSNPDKYACTTATTPTTGAIAQCFQGAVLDFNKNAHGSWGAPAFLAGGSGSNQQNWLYVAWVNDVLKAYQMASNGLFSTTPISSANAFAYPGASPSVTWNSNNSSNINDAIVWALDTSGYLRSPAGAAVLYAYQAVPGTPPSSLTTLWDTSEYNKTGPGSPGAVKFVVPTIVDGRIFLAGGEQGYVVGQGNCATFPPTACGAVAMYK
jgi:hypothetical protein